ncbi:IS110 family transposase [Halobacteriales archaeon SW_10_66_29]|nr:MAG: IS110 family transposase [Halobacteriales archaeon SW_10_66_29]
MAYIGIDVHKTASQIAVLPEEPTGTDDVEPLEEIRVENANLDEFAHRYEGSEAVLEATSNYYTIYETLDKYLDVKVANPLEMKWIAEAAQKTDEIDAKKLAELDQHGVRYDDDLFTKEGREFLAELALEEPGTLLLEQWLETIDDLTERIETLDEEIEEIAADCEHPQLLQTIPGVGAYSAVVIYAEIGEIERFEDADKLVSYAGLDPTVRESGDSRTEGSISKEGNSQLRDVLVRAAKVAVHTCNDPYLSTFYWRLRGEKNKPALVARVATARKLLISIYHMLDREEEYDPPGVSD